MDVSKEDIKCARKLSGEMNTDQERSMFEVNLLLDDGLRDRFQDYKLLWECYPKPDLPLKKKQSGNRIREAISPKASGKRMFLQTKMKVILAAAAVVLIGFSLYLFSMGDASRYTNHIIAQQGERKQITLPDGSSITINSGSELKFPEVFSKNSREVWLEGEAYFDISKDVDRPFHVSTDGLTVQVLGTKFNVNTKGKTKTVSLESGKVQVTLKDSGDEIQLSPNEELLLNTETGEVVKRNFDVSKTTAWKDNILLLDNMSLGDALIPINQFYGVEFTISDDLVASKKVSAAFEDQDLEQFIQTLEFIADVKITPVSPKKFSIAPRDEN